MLTTNFRNIVARKNENSKVGVASLSHQISQKVLG